MTHVDLTKLAVDMLHAHQAGLSMRLPAMTIREFAALSQLLRQLDTPATIYVH